MAWMEFIQNELDLVPLEEEAKNNILHFFEVALNPLGASEFSIGVVVSGLEKYVDLSPGDIFQKKFLDVEFESNDHRDRQLALVFHIIRLVTAFTPMRGKHQYFYLETIKSLIFWEPISPITFEDDQWDDKREYECEPAYQHKRATNVFKNSDGSIYHIDHLWVVDDENENEKYLSPIQYTYKKEITTPSYIPKTIRLESSLVKEMCQDVI